MNRENRKYFFLGLIIVLAVIFLIAADGDDPNSKRFQAYIVALDSGNAFTTPSRAASGGRWGIILDTVTGDYVYIGGDEVQTPFRNN